MPITVPDFVPGIGGTTIGPSDQQPAPPDTTTRDQYIAGLAAQHGGISGKPAPQTTKVGSEEQLTGFDLYTFADGTTVEVAEDGRVQNYKPKQPRAQANRPTRQYTQYNPDGSEDTFTYDSSDGGNTWNRNDSMPVEHKPADPSRRVPSDPSTWLQIHSIPNDPSSRVIALQDPANSSNRVTVPQDTQPDKPTVVKGDNGAMYSWDGKTLSPLMAGTPEKKQIIQGQNGLVQTWDGTNLVTIQPGTPKPAEGSTQTRLVNGRNVQGTIIGGEFVPQKDLGPALQGAATEGATRPNIVEGYNVEQTYRNGEWTTTKIGDRAIPKEPTVVNAPANQAYITTMGSGGQLSSQINPSFTPTTQAEVGAKVSQLQQQAATKKDEFLGKVGPTYTVQQAQADWNQWWDQNVEPQRANLQQISQQARAEEARKAAESERANYATAQTAGTSAVDAYKATIPYRVGPGFADLLGTLGKAYQGGPLPSTEQIQQGVMFKMPDLDQISQQATARALAHISPTAAGIAGTGPPSMLQQTPQDLTAGLNRTAYSFPGAGGGTTVPPQTISSRVAPFSNPVPAAGAFTNAAPSTAWTGAFQAAPAAAPYMASNWQQPPNSNPWGTYQPGF